MGGEGRMGRDAAVRVIFVAILGLGLPLLDAACPDKARASIVSPMQGDILKEAGPIVEYSAWFGEGWDERHGTEGEKLEVVITLDDEKVATLSEQTGQVTLAGLSNGIHSLGIYATCGGHRVGGEQGAAQASFFYGYPVEEPHDLVDPLLSWARTHEYRIRTALMEDAMRHFALSHDEETRELRAKLAELEDIVARHAGKCEAAG